MVKYVYLGMFLWLVSAAGIVYNLELREEYFKAEKVIVKSSQSKKLLSENNSYMKIFKDGYCFSEKELPKYYKGKNKTYYEGKNTPAGVYIFFDNSGKQVVAAAALGTDLKYHFVNSYLVGYVPFRTKKLWVPQDTIAMKISYQLDENQFKRMDEVWQTSKEVFLKGRGDCEDHAILLADWLIEMRIDARVVCGKAWGRWHAWVVAFYENKEFLLEATSKRSRHHWCHYPLSIFAKDYKPEFMFNRDYFWFNSGSKLTRSYRGNQWHKMSQYFTGQRR